jgi:uncharacterized alkaline shock family protein YloU
LNTHSHDHQLSEGAKRTLDTGEEDGRPELSHEVVATYVADAVRSIPGVGLHASPWKGLSSRVRDSYVPGVAVHDSDGQTDVEIHVKLAWNSYIPSVAQEIEESVRSRTLALLDLRLRKITVFVDEIAAPTEVDAPSED